MLLAKGHKVRALVRREDERAGALRRLGAEVVQGDLTDLASMHRAIEGCVRIYFGMSVSAAYLEATVNTATVARHHGVEAFVNMSQMTVTQMSATHLAHHNTRGGRLLAIINSSCRVAFDDYPTWRRRPLEGWWYAPVVVCYSVQRRHPSAPSRAPTGLRFCPACRGRVGESIQHDEIVDRTVIADPR
jgi:NAD(P)-dependent dehydrogenase (short-subunit alcohol dehydrogenase family)